MTVAIPTTNNHTALALPDVHDAAALQLIEWAKAADAAFELAKVLCSTQFAPAAYRSKPAEAAAAMIAGAEVGLSPMASMRAFHNIQGTPSPAAITLRAIVQGKGHDIRIDKSDDDVAVVSGRRKGSQDWQTSTWTFARADAAGFPKKNPNWNTQRAAMLVARATAEVCRWIASDAIMGMPYSVEELMDEGRTFEPRDPARRVTSAEIVDATPDPVPPVQATLDRPEPPPVDTRPMFAALDDANLLGRDDKLDFIAETIGRRIGLPQELSADEVEQITAAARALVPPQDGGDQ